MLDRGREAGAQGGRLRGTSKDDLLKVRRRLQRPFALPEKEVRQRLDVRARATTESEPHRFPG
jgi:hypothetical protein